MADKDQKTEQPTQRRVKKARDEGNFPSARVFVNAIQFLAFVSLVHSWGPIWVTAIHRNLAQLLNHASTARMDAMFIVQMSLELVKQTLLPLLILGGVLMLVTLAAQFLVTRLGVSLKKLTPDFKRLNPMARVKELPKQNIPAFLQAVVMLPVFGAVVYFLVRDNFDSLLALPLTSAVAGAAQVGSTLESLLWKASGLFLVFGLVDLFRQKRRYQQDMRMSKQEIRDELKEMEGNPLMKARIRRIRRDMARRRMMQEVPKATAVVVNPTHYAVALKYEMNTQGAPKVVAKGKNYLALRIRQKAIDAGVPLIENPPLAQGLYKSVDVGQEIPAEFYRAVAEILAYVYRLMHGKLPA
ncbi:MAG: EscU/YscU/HrcU family type III secretion system export apparatus switch protein [Acidobacteriia bacterium]|nr:EscU/YscU/HrcU family type III secretion system export apparatus switch protein [Terriglobia bacterium]